MAEGWTPAEAAPPARLRLEAPSTLRMTLFKLARVSYRLGRWVRYPVQVTADGGPDGNRTLARAAAIIDAVARGGALTAVELAERAGLSRSTAHRLALAMVSSGFLARSSGGSFSPGFRLSEVPLERFAVGALEVLSQRTRESSQLWVRRATERVCVVSVDGVQAVRAVVRVGSYAPLSSGSTGLLLMNDPAALQSVDERGWVESVDDDDELLATVSAPVYRHQDVIGVVSIALPVSRGVISVGEDHGYEVAAAARALSAGVSG